MFFANIFSYWQRKRLCAMAFAKTRQSLLARAAELQPLLRRHGITLRLDRLQEDARTVHDSVNDARPLRPDVKTSSVRQTKRDLRHALDTLERAIAVAR